MGFRPSSEDLKDIIEEIDEDKSGEIEFPEFCQLCAKFLIEEPDDETMKAELKEAFRYFKTRKSLVFFAGIRRFAICRFATVDLPWSVRHMRRFAIRRARALLGLVSPAGLG